MRPVTPSTSHPVTPVRREPVRQDIGAAVDQPPGRGGRRDLTAVLLVLAALGAYPLVRALRGSSALGREMSSGGLTLVHTTSQLLGNLLHEILADADIERALRESDDALGRAIEESLRLAPPILFMARGCVRDVEIGGCPLSPGTRVLAGFASANRDERVFDDPDEFRVDRPNAEHHRTCGYGAHVCPGAALARTVARIGIRTFLDRFPSGTVRLEPGFEFENVPTYFEVGPKRLPVELTR